MIIHIKCSIIAAIVARHVAMAVRCILCLYLITECTDHNVCASTAIPSCQQIMMGCNGVRLVTNSRM